MHPIETFEDGEYRANFLVGLFRLLENRRDRSIRSDWANKFQTLAGWPRKEAISRVDGDHAMLLLRPQSGFTDEMFDSASLQDLLRSALVSIVASLDRYVHDAILRDIVSVIKTAQSSWTAELRSVHVPLSDVKTSVLKAGKRTGQGGKKRPRPFLIVKRGLQEELHKHVFQKPDDVATGLRIIGVSNLWQDVGKQTGTKPEEIKRRLLRIVQRRNQIVHEGDVVRRLRGGRLEHRAIQRAEVKGDIDWISQLAHAIEKSIP